MPYSMSQRCYGGVRLLDGNKPSIYNVERLDMGATPMVIAMQRQGLQVDLSHFAAMEKTLNEDMDSITNDVKSLTGYYINPGSPDQIADLLFKKMGLKQARLKLTDSGSRESVEDAVLTAIQHDHPVVPKLLEYAELSKLRGTYVVPMPKLARRVAFGKWRMYPNFRTTRVPSGRLSCTEPNLLAMPTRTTRGKEIRKGFITDAGWKIVSVDESQIEPRIAAHRSMDESLLKVYANEEDLYSDFATASFRLEDKRYKSPGGKWKYPTVDPLHHRYPAKTCVLAALYCITAGGLLEKMPVVCANCHLEATKHTCSNFSPYWTEAKCQDQLNAFYIKYPGLIRMQRQDHAYARRHAMICDMWGRILHVTAVRSVLEWVVNGALREVTNFPMQGSAQGTIKLTMAAVYDDICRSYSSVAFPLLQVHDELLFECREDVAGEFGRAVAHRFENCVKLNVPIKASVATADTWGDLDK